MLNPDRMKVSKKQEAAARHAFFALALDNAHAAARAAQVGMVEDMNAFDCGFAWVVVHDLAFSGWCRKQAKACENPFVARRYGSKHYATGWSFWKPGDAPVQSIGIHEAGARAFRDSLAQSLQVRVEMGSRLD